MIKYKSKGGVTSIGTPLAEGHAVDQTVGQDHQSPRAELAGASALLVIIRLHQFPRHVLQIEVEAAGLTVGGRVRQPL